MTAVDRDLVARGLMTLDGYLTPAGQGYVEPILDRLAPYVPRAPRTAAQQNARLLWNTKGKCK